MRARLLALLLVIALVAGCAKPGDDAADSATPEANGTTDAPPEEAAPAAAELSVALVERPSVGVPPMTMGIDPAQLSAQAGQTVRIAITNGGQGPHNLVVEGHGESDLIDGGGEGVLEFVAQEKGEYAMYCSVGGDGPTGHRAQGMSGTFVVE